MYALIILRDGFVNSFKEKAPDIMGSESEDIAYVIAAQLIWEEDLVEDITDSVELDKFYNHIEKKEFEKAVKLFNKCTDSVKFFVSYIGVQYADWVDVKNNLLNQRDEKG